MKKHNIAIIESSDLCFLNNPKKEKITDIADWYFFEENLFDIEKEIKDLNEYYGLVLKVVGGNAVGDLKAERELEETTEGTGTA